MRISRIKVNNFKSLVDFDLPMEKFTCLIGLNGSGKSTVLQFVDFLCHLMNNDLTEFLSQRQWDSDEFVNNRENLAFGEYPQIEYRVDFCDDFGADFGYWEAVYSPFDLVCTSEAIHADSCRLTVENGHYSIDDSTPIRIVFSYQGSVLSQLRDDSLPKQVYEIKQAMSSVHSLDLLDLNFLRRPQREDTESVGPGGVLLASYLHQSDATIIQDIVQSAKKVYPRLVNVSTKESGDRWVQLYITESVPGVGGKTRMVETRATHASEGLLRTILYLAELSTKFTVLLLDEIESGINPEIVEFLVDKLVNARQQVMVTTHSPMILNYLDDEVAKKSVVYLYKTDAGHTKAIRFFNIPSMAEKLKVMGPGEVFVDTKLSALAEEIAALPKAGES